MPTNRIAFHRTKSNSESNCTFAYSEELILRWEFGHVVLSSPPLPSAAAPDHTHNYLQLRAEAGAETLDSEGDVDVREL